MIVVAIDPGAGTGISTYDTVTGEFNTREVFGFADAATFIEWEIAANNDVECVCEDYIITARTAQLTQQTEPLRLRGVAEHECLKRGVKITLHRPSVRKTGEAKLKTLGWFRKTKDGHSNSASGHLLVYLLNNRLLHEEDRMRLIKALDD